MKSEEARKTYRRVFGGVMLGLANLALILFLIDRLTSFTELQTILAYLIGLQVGTVIISIIGGSLRVVPGWSAKVC